MHACSTPAGIHPHAGASDQGPQHALPHLPAGRGGLLDPEFDLGAGQLGTGSDVDQYLPELAGKLVRGPRRGARGAPSPAELVRHWVAKQVSCGYNHTAAVVECYD
jgi:hypothetical protein